MTQKQTSKHRHFLVAPIFGFMMTFSLFTSGVLLSSNTWQLFGFVANEQSILQNVVIHQSGIAVWINEGSKIETQDSIIKLDNGSVLVAGQSLVPLYTDNYFILGLNGTYGASLTEGKLIISAVTSPVLIDNGEALMVVPIGHEWSVSDSLSNLEEGLDNWINDRKLKRIPKTYLKRKLEIAKVLNANIPDLLPDEKLLKQTLQSNLILPKLPKSQEKSDEAYVSHLIGYLRGILAKDDLAKLQEVLSDPSVQTHLKSQVGKKYLGALLSSSRKASITWLPLYRIFAGEQNIALLSAFHPQFRNGAWVLNSDYLNKETRLIRLLFFPISNILPDGANEFVLERFKQEARLLQTELVDPTLYLHHLFKIGSGMIKTYEEQGYPGRTKNMVDVLTIVGLSSKSLLNDETNKILEKLLKFEEININFEAIVLDSEEPEDVVELETNKQEVQPTKVEDQQVVRPQLSPQQTSQLARLILSANKGLFTTSTQITPKENNIAYISKIIYPGVNRKMNEYTFEIDVTDQKIFNIQLNGQRYPNAVSVPLFVKWATNM